MLSEILRFKYGRCCKEAMNYETLFFRNVELMLQERSIQAVELVLEAMS